MIPDDVCREHSESEIQIRVTELEDVVLIEGTAESLLFLSKLFAAQSESPSDSFSISPSGAGRAWFTRDSTKGIYIKRVEKLSMNTRQRKNRR